MEFKKQKEWCNEKYNSKYIEKCGYEFKHSPGTAINQKEKYGGKKCYERRKKHFKVRFSVLSNILNFVFTK